MGKYNIQDLFIGQYFEKNFVVTEDMGKMYAEISQDYNPIHLNTEIAKASRFGQKLVHGMLVGSFISGVIGNEFPGAGSIYMHQKLVFKCPVYYSTNITIRIEIDGINLEKKHVLLKTQCYDSNRKLLVDGNAKILLED